MAPKSEQYEVGPARVNRDELPAHKLTHAQAKALHASLAGGTPVLTSRRTQSRTVNSLRDAGLIDWSYNPTRLGFAAWLAVVESFAYDHAAAERYVRTALSYMRRIAVEHDDAIGAVPTDVRRIAIAKINDGAYPHPAVQQAQIEVWEARHDLAHRRLSLTAALDAMEADRAEAIDEGVRRRGFTPLSEIAVDDVVTITPNGDRQFDVVEIDTIDGALLRVWPRDGIVQGDRWPGWVGGSYVRKVPAEQIAPYPAGDEPVGGVDLVELRTELARMGPAPRPWADGIPGPTAERNSTTAARAAGRAGKAYHLALHDLAAARADKATGRAAAIAEALPGLRESAVELGVDVAAIEREAEADELRGSHADHMRHVADRLREIAGVRADIAGVPVHESADVPVSRAELRRLAGELAPPHTECKAAALARRAIAVQHATMTTMIDLARPERPVPPATLRALVMAVAQAIAEPEPHVDQLVEHIKSRAGAAIVAETGTDPADVDALVDQLLSEGWTWAAEPEFVLGKRLRYLAPPAAVDAGVDTPADEPLPAAAPRHQAPAGAPFRLCTLHGADCRSAQNGRPCSGMPADGEPTPPAPGNLVDVRPGDVWRDVTLRVTWHARDNGNGDVELYEPNGPGRVPAHMLSHNRGGWRLLGRDWPAGAVPFDGGDGPTPGYAAGDCGHRVALSEWRAGFRACEQAGCKAWQVGDRARHPRWSELLFVVSAIDDEPGRRVITIVAQNVTGRVYPYELVRVPEPQPLTDDELREWLRLRCAPADVEFWVEQLRGKTLDECDKAHDDLHGDMA